MAGFAKLSGSIVHSTVWREPHTTRIVWVTMLALADAEGYVGASVPGLADAARVTLTECEAALASFLAPDPYSRTRAHDGRRIEVADGGWRLLNYGAYREGRDSEARRRQNREAKRRQRQRERGADTLTKADRADLSAGQPESAQAEAEAEAEAEADPDPPVGPPKGDSARMARAKPSKARKRKPETTTRPADWKPGAAHRAYAATHDLDVELEAEGFAAHHDSKGNQFVRWDAAFTTWLTQQARWNRQRGASGGRNGVPLVQRGGTVRAGDASWLQTPETEPRPH